MFIIEFNQMLKCEKQRWCLQNKLGWAMTNVWQVKIEIVDPWCGSEIIDVALKYRF